MSRLLDCPQEIQDTIIEYALCQERSIPCNTLDLKQSRRILFTKPISYENPDLYVRYEKDPPQILASRLQLVNKQLYLTTRAAIARLFPKGSRCKLDIVILDYGVLQPTWVLIPFYSNRIEVLDVTVRHYITRPNGRPEHPLLSDIRRGRGFRKFLWLKTIFECFWNQFLNYGIHPHEGVVYDRSNESQNSLTVSTINIDFASSYDMPNWDGDIPAQHWSYRDRAINNLYWPLIISPHQASFGNTVYEQVGKMNFSVNGHLLKQRDYGRSLAEITGIIEFPVRILHFTKDIPLLCRYMTFWNWKYRTYLIRKERELSLEDDTAWVWPTHDEIASNHDQNAFVRRNENVRACDLLCCLCSLHDLEDMVKAKSEA
jgi:hypothetical protein